LFARFNPAAIVCTAMAAFCFPSMLAAAPPIAPGVPGASRPVRLLDVPYVPQTEALCGGAAVAMVLRYWGDRGVLAEDFAASVEPGGAGIRTDSLVAAVRGRGWKAFPLNGTDSIVEAEPAAGHPLIALVREGHDALHYVVVVAHANGGVITHDPAVAPFRASGVVAFDRAWAPTGRWALLILPPDRGVDASGPDSSVPNAPDPRPAVVAGCDAVVADAIARARSGDTAGAEARLRSAAALCPESAAPLRGLAGLRFQAEDWAGAARFAEQALDREPEDAYTWRLLAGSRFLAGNEVGALHAWNHVSEPRADLARIDGLARTRYRTVAAQLDLPPGRLLTPGAFVRARRRLAEMPAPSAARLSLKPLPLGAAQVDVAMLERPLVFNGPFDAGVTGLRALTEQELSLRVSSPTGNGELWTIGGRWQEERPRASLALAIPAPGGRPGLWRVEGYWERQAYATGEAVPGADGAVRRPVVREERRRSELSFADWVGPTLRAEAGAALDKWSGTGAHLSLNGTVEALLVGDRLSLSARGAQWTSLARGPGFETGDLLARWGPTLPGGNGWRARLGLSAATSASPLALWPGAGTGRGRVALLRAHPLLTDGVLAGPAFGRTLVTTGVERTSWAFTFKSFRVGWSLFLDGARVWNPAGRARVPWLIDGGASLRLAAPATRGEFRLTAAHGLEDGASAFSAGWEVH